MIKVKIENEVLTGKVLNWLEYLKVGDKYGRYRLCSLGGESLFTSCVVVFIRDLLDDLNNLDEQKKREWSEYIQSRQNPQTGYFSDPDMQADEDFKGIWESNYVLEEATNFSLMALSALGTSPLYKLSFLDYFKNKDNLLNYLKGLNWKEPWYQSNKVMFKLSLLIDDYERSNNDDSRQCIYSIMDWLDSWQDPKTGLWGANLGVSKYHCVFTTFHFLFFYFYLGRKVNYIPQMIDSVLSIQNRKDGLFSPHGGGGACPDLDAVDILVKLSLITDYRREDIKKALEKAFYGVINNQNEDGGFCWARKSPFTPMEWIRSFPNIMDKNSRTRGLYNSFLQLLRTHFLPKGYLIHYDGLDYLTYYSAESNVFSTWFRLLTLALIDTRYPGKYMEGIRWKFPQKAGLGWHNPDLKSATCYE